MRTKPRIVIVSGQAPKNLFPAAWTAEHRLSKADFASVTEEIAAGVLYLFDGREFLPTNSLFQRLVIDGLDIPDPTVLTVEEFRQLDTGKVTLIVVTPQRCRPVGWRWLSKVYQCAA